MSAPLRRLLLAIAALVVAVAALVPAGSAGAQDPPAEQPATGSPEVPSGDPAIDDLVGCVQSSQQLLVLFLIDESASLKANDPDDRRIDAARSALDSLVALSAAEGAASPQIDVALAAFSNEYRLIQDWTTISEAGEAELDAALASFADLENGIDTDFVNALSAGREALGDRAAQVGTGSGLPPCRAVLLFTDGGYDLAVRTSPEQEERLGTTKPYAPDLPLTSEENVRAAEAAGRDEMCRPGGTGLADRLRNDDVTLLTVALSAGVPRRSQRLLASATAGVADGKSCGTLTDRPKGAYLPAEDIDVLVTSFNEVGTRLAGGNRVPGEEQVQVCGSDPCDEGTRTFQLDQTLRRAQVVALAPAPGTAVVIEGPDGEQATVDGPGAIEVGAVTGRARELAGRGFAIDLDRPVESEGWAGEWKASIVDPSGDQEGEPATLQIYVFSDIGVTLTAGTVARGERADLQVELVLPPDVDAKDVVAATTVEVRLRNPITGSVESVPLQGPPAGPFLGSYEVPADLTSNGISAVAEARITTTGGAALVSLSPSTELLVRRPGGAIQFAPASLAMPALTGDGTTEADLVVLGGAKDGCVWFGSIEVPEAPEGAAPIVLTDDGQPLPTEGDCLEVAAGERITLRIVAEPDGRATGTVRGALEVFERTDGVDDASLTQVPFRFDMSRGVDQTRRLLLALGFLVVGLGLPVLLLLLINAATARFQVLDAVQGAAVPVRVAGDAIVRTDASYARSFALRDGDFGNLAHAGSDRQFTFGGVVFRARASKNPFSGTVAMAAPEGGAEKLKGNVGRRVELDPALAGSWVFLLDADKTRRAPRGEAHGLLIAFVAEGEVSPQVQRMMPDITMRLPATASRLAGLVRGTKRKPPAKAKGKAARTEAAPAPGEAPEAEAEVPAAEVVDAPAPPAAEVPAAEAVDAPPAADAPEPPAAPVGFGGSAAGPAEPTSADDGDDGPGEDPPAPPIGFSGSRPDA